MTARRATLWGLGLVAAILVVAQLNPPPRDSPSRSPTTPAARVVVPPKLPKLLVTVERVTYEHGYVKATGVAKNVGTDGAHSPRLKLSVFDSATGNTLLAETTTWPAGQAFKTMPPDLSAAFQLFTSIPGEPSTIRWLITVDGDIPYEVVGPAKKK